MALPQYDYASPGGRGRLAWSTVVEWARSARALGFESVWLADHLFMSIEKYGAPPGEHFGFDPILGLAALARHVPDVRLGTLVLCPQLRPVRLLATQLESLTSLAPGRTVIGVGAGWLEAEFRAAGVPFLRPGLRLEQLREALAVIRTAVGPTAPLWVGGKGDRLLDIVARQADGWNTVWQWTVEDYKRRSDVLDQACERVGRDPAEVTRSVGLYALVGEDEKDLRRRFERLRQVSPPGVLPDSLSQWRHGRLVGTVDEVRAQRDEWSAIGVTSLVAGLGGVPFSGTDQEDLPLLASALI